MNKLISQKNKVSDLTFTRKAKQILFWLYDADMVERAISYPVAGPSSLARKAKAWESDDVSAESEISIRPCHQ